MDNTNGKSVGATVSDGVEYDPVVAYTARASQWRKIAEISIAALSYYRAALSNHPPGRRASKRERELFKALKAAGVTKEEAINGTSF